MMDNRFQYRKLMHKAMQGLMAEVLMSVAEDGLPGEHYFLIVFDTTHPGVDMADYLMERFPTEMTVILQHQFDDLMVAKDRFSVTLSFSDKPEQIVVPFDSIKTFADPSVEFGLGFDAQESEEGPDLHAVSDEPEDEPPSPGGGDVVSLDKFRKHEQ